MSDDDSCNEMMEDESNEIMNNNVEIIITLNNELVKTIKNLEKINAQLCRMVSNIGNVSFMINQKINDIQDQL